MDIIAANIGQIDRDKEIYRLKEENAALVKLRDGLSLNNAILQNLLDEEHRKLTALTALIESDEVAEKVAREDDDPPSGSTEDVTYRRIVRRHAIDDYRKMLREEMK